MNRVVSTAAAALVACSFFPARALADLPGEGYRNHLVISLGVGIGSLSPSQYNSYVDTFNSASGSAAPASPAHVGFELHVPVILTYYFADYVLLRTGAEAAYFFPSESLGSESVTNYGGIVEVPILLGGHYALLDNRLIVELAMGPGIAAYTSAGLSGSAQNGYTGTQYYGDVAVGFDSELKGQYFVTPSFSVGLELGLRSLTSSALHDGSGNPAPPQNGSPLQLDMSGFRAVLEFGFVAF